MPTWLSWLTLPLVLATLGGAAAAITITKAIVEPVRRRRRRIEGPLLEAHGTYRHDTAGGTSTLVGISIGVTNRSDEPLQVTFVTVGEVGPSFSGGMVPLQEGATTHGGLTSPSLIVTRWVDPKKATDLYADGPLVLPPEAGAAAAQVNVAWRFAGGKPRYLSSDPIPFVSPGHAEG